MDESVTQWLRIYQLYAVLDRLRNANAATARLRRGGLLAEGGLA